MSDTNKKGGRPPNKVVKMDGKLYSLQAKRVEELELLLSHKLGRDGISGYLAGAGKEVLPPEVDIDLDKQ